MDKIIDYLEQLELSEIEAKLYVALLDTGPISVRDLAETIEIKRTTAYLYIDLLVEKGLVMKMVKGSQKVVAPNSPDSLKYLVEKKLESAKKVQEEFPTVLKKITDLYSNTKNNGDAEIKYYKGKNGVKKIYDEVLIAKEVRSYVNIEEIAEVFPENFPMFDNALKQNQDMEVFEIVEESSEARKRFETIGKRERYFHKFLPKNMRMTAQDILIYDDRIAIIHFKDKINGVVLRNADLYNNFKLLFDFIWKILPE